MYVIETCSCVWLVQKFACEILATADSLRIKSRENFIFGHPVDKLTDEAATYVAEAGVEATVESTTGVGFTSGASEVSVTDTAITNARVDTPSTIQTRLVMCTVVQVYNGQNRTT